MAAREAAGKLFDVLVKEKAADQNEMDSSPSRQNAWKMFDRIASRYDFLNHLLSLGFDIIWRRRVARFLPRVDHLSLLDLACGTGDMLLSLSQSVDHGVGLDMSSEMLKSAGIKIMKKGRHRRFSLVRADGQSLPFADSSFDVVTIAFGIRNMVDVSDTLKEIHRVLKKKGRALILEFSLPENRFLRRLYLFYFRNILPRIGTTISGDSYAYRYLMETVISFPYGDDFCALMKQAGFENVRANCLTMGIASIYQGDRTAPGRIS